ncbi:flagellar basal body rod protein FlgC [Algiphilus sp.]|uniref:flagellar basal body rod protein FlgC n=1 Tax=Algiphilus sp. TaxID=1872431 RepID=UPI001CA7AFE6|nr:flagellar basal body rod protein FlgC [Algiphilus sp.]MBY8967008.1 flagellar basal body rod protein FlgC [Algiphilus acroporae]MCI5062151.1 flagellar basal body rod protein FlgC [Algiphilus sp.]MCI5103764.1 flagellar basal body rod protein FlgC [Algiphilus sp.]MCR9091386.1 flagellar basal body rod protein FlgC [Pseudomonadota bacterium]
MSSLRIFDIAASAMSAQNTRLNATASNLANVDSVAASPEQAYRARVPLFQTVMDAAGVAGVRTDGVVDSQKPPEARYEPGHPMANEEGYIYAPAINTVEEMANMISASRSYQNAVDVMSTSRDLMLATLQIGRS